MIQLNDATEAVKSIGLNPTITLIVVIALVGGFMVIVKWLMKHIEKKDDELKAVRDIQLDMMKAQTAATVEVAHSLEAMNVKLDRQLEKRTR